MGLAFHGHIAGCYENEDGHIVYDLTVADGNVFFWWPSDDHPVTGFGKRNQLNSPTTRWIFDPKMKSGSRVTPHETWQTNGEFSRIDDRWVTKKYNHFVSPSTRPSAVPMHSATLVPNPLLSSLSLT